MTKPLGLSRPGYLLMDMKSVLTDVACGLDTSTMSTFTGQSDRGSAGSPKSSSSVLATFNWNLSGSQAVLTKSGAHKCHIAGQHDHHLDNGNVWLDADAQATSFKAIIGSFSTAGRLITAANTLSPNMLTSLQMHSPRPLVISKNLRAPFLFTSFLPPSKMRPISRTKHSSSSQSRWSRDDTQA
jgi:hypothetical protein